jgi:hypothetical protein
MYYINSRRKVMKSFKKLTIAMLSIIILSSLFTFADDSDIKYDLNDYLEIINPSFSEINNVEVKKNLFISMNIKQKEDMYLTVKRIVPVMDELYFDKIINDEIDKDELINSIADRVIDINSINEMEMIDDESIITERERITVIIDRYVKEYIKNKQMQLEFVSMTREVNLFYSDLVNGYDPIIVEKYNKLREEYFTELKIFNEIKDDYSELFKVKILDKDAIMPVGVMPYYEKTLEDISPGRYEMVIELFDEDRYMLKKINFNVVIKQEEEIIIQDKIELIQSPIINFDLEE